MADWVHAVERAYVAVATSGAPGRAATAATADPRARAAAGAVASHYLAVGTPRSIGLVGNRDALFSLEAHRTWFRPTDVRCTDAAVAAEVGGRVVPLAEALTADIVCIHEPITLAEGLMQDVTEIARRYAHRADLSKVPCVSSWNSKRAEALKDESVVVAPSPAQARSA